MERAHLEVGGVVFASSLANLRKSPVLAPLFERGVPDAIPFIDRDPQLFSYVLGMLRADHVYFGAEEVAHLRALRAESVYFKLPDLTRLIDAQLASHEHKEQPHREQPHKEHAHKEQQRDGQPRERRRWGDR